MTTTRASQYSLPADAEEHAIAMIHQMLLIAVLALILGTNNVCSKQPASWVEASHEQAIYLRPLEHLAESAWGRYWARPVGTQRFESSRSISSENWSTRRRPDQT